MGDKPQDGAGPWKLPTQGHATAHRETAKETGGWELGITTIVGGNSGSRLQGDWEIHHEQAEHGRAVYYDATNSGPL